MAEAVNHPKHYGGKDAIYEVIKTLEAWLTPEQFIGYCRGSYIAYMARAGKKGDVDEDLRKAEWYSAYERDYRKRVAVGDIGENRAPKLGNIVLHMVIEERTRQLYDALGVPEADRSPDPAVAFAAAVATVKNLRTHFG